jgi:hypothetical protein
MRVCSASSSVDRHNCELCVVVVIVSWNFLRAWRMRFALEGEQIDVSTQSTPALKRIQNQKFVCI